MARNPLISRLSTLAVVGALVCIGACKSPPKAANGEKDDAEAAKDTEGEASNDADETEPAAPAPALDALVAWLDPEAVAAVFIRDDKDLDPLVVGSVFGLPPQATELLEAAHDVDFGLDAVFGPNIETKEWLGEATLVMAPPMASDVYILRPLLKPKAEFEAMLEKTDLISAEVEGFKIWVPRGAFPYKIVALDEQAVGFIPARELGSGLGPLTAGRDMPPSDLEKQITQFMNDDPAVFVTLHAGGPLMHLDLPHRIAMTQLALKEWKTGGIDAQVVLQPMGDVDETANTLEEREHPEETHQVQMLMDDVAFVPEGEVVVGRLQIPPERVRHLQ
jgi:hypothetical protein